MSYPDEFGPEFFNALCWVVMTVFPEDLQKGLIAQGTNEAIARDITSAYSCTRPRNIIQFYQDYAHGCSDKSWQPILAKFISSRLADYKKYNTTGKEGCA